MRNRILSASLGAALWLAPAPAVQAETVPTDPAPAATPAVPGQDVLFLGDEKPVVIRLHVQLEGGKSIASGWEDYLRAMIKYMDRDNDGMLNETEAKFLPTAQMMLQAQQSGFFIGQNNYAPFADLKKDPQATKVSFEDLSAYYRKVGIGTLRISAPQQNFGRPTNGLTEALFKTLDTNSDGKISKEEILAGEKSLMKLDADDDETISAAEVVGIGGQAQLYGGMPAPAAPLPLVSIDSKGDLTALGTRMLGHYDRDKNGKLSREEVGLEAGIFDKLDLNRDGNLDGTEVLGLLRLDPGIELNVRLGKLDLDQKPVQSVRGLTPNMKATAESLVVTLGNTQIDFGRTEAGVAANVNGYRQFYIQQFKAADKKKQGFLEVADFDNRQIQFLKPIMPLIDRDGDGKLTEKELTDYMDLQAQVTTTAFTLQVGEGGQQGMFELIDSNKDGRLSVKELRTAWERIGTWDRNADGAIARSEIPRQMEVTVTRGQAAFGRGRMVVMQPNMGFNPAAPRGPAKGPLWFRKMDRNGDGMLSPREFVGTAEDFKKLDADGDGFIDAAEAEKAAGDTGKRVEVKP